MAILEYITELIAQKGSGFYCIITTNNEITDIIKVVAEGRVIKSILMHGDKQMYSAEDIANMIEMEGAGDGFVFLNDVVLIPEPTNQEIADQWKDETLGGRVVLFEEWPSAKDVDYHYADALKNGNGNDNTPEESALDLIGRENMDYTISANDHVNKDKELE